MIKETHDKFLRVNPKFCSGCGNVIVFHSILSAIENLYGTMDGIVFLSGIGCAAWITSPHIKADTIHTTHGRSITFAAGVKLANPNLKVVVISGDGDLAGIGGNHLFHAARRNLEITVICVDNLVYGMTGGQLSPTTPLGVSTSTTQKGNIEYPFDLARLVSYVGASYSARWTTTHKKQMQMSIEKALKKGQKGFSFVEIISPCPTQFTRRNLKTFKTIKNEVYLGEFIDIEREGYVKKIRITNKESHSIGVKPCMLNF
jgi:2-oxoglutarate ferredoxin oxidoreductase subunit beta